MRISLFTQIPYRQLPDGFHLTHESAVTTPYSWVDPDVMVASYRQSLDEALYAARAGFDGIAFTEHAQSAYDLAPNPNLLCAAMANITAHEGLDVAIYPVGRSLGKTREPLRVAEEYAMIDAISGGRLIAGFPVGLPYDASINNGVPPTDLRARFDENLALILRAWQDLEPFAWNGRFSQHPVVNLWPRPVQGPRPPVWITGVGSPATMRFSLQNGFGYNFFGSLGAKLTGTPAFERFWSTADELGEPRNPFRITFVQAICVGETDEQARRDWARHIEYHFRGLFGAIPMHYLAMPGSVPPPGLNQMLKGGPPGGVDMKHCTADELIDAGCVVVGSPERVAEELEGYVRDFGYGHLLAALQLGDAPTALTMKSIDLFVERVMPLLRPIWEDDGWENHWWPERLGGAGQADRPSTVKQVS